MRDSALKRGACFSPTVGNAKVGEELMRDSALKPAKGKRTVWPFTSSEKSSCATAL